MSRVFFNKSSFIFKNSMFIRVATINKKLIKIKKNAKYFYIDAKKMKRMQI
jgi:hypothetical protein